VVPWPAEDGELEELDRVRDLTDPSPAMVDELLANLEAQDVPVGREPGRRPSRRAPLALAAALLMALVSAWVLVFRAGGPDPGPPMILALTGPEETRTVSPVPGVEATLQPGTELAVGLSGDDVWLLALAEGETHVVVHGEAIQRPVRVMAGDVGVTVTGTRFAVARAGRQVSVRVEEGSVRVDWPDGTANLNAGQDWVRQAPSPPLADVGHGGQPAASLQLPPPPPTDAVPTPGRQQIAMATPGVQSGAPPFPDLTTDEEDTLSVGDPATDLLARIQTDRALGRPADARLPDLERYIQLHDDTAAAEEVMALHIEALAATGANLETIARAYDYLEAHPEGTRRVGVRWIEATVARDRLHDCSLALEAYRELASIPGPRQAEAAYYLGTCSADLGKDEDARRALEGSLELGLEGPRAQDARSRLGDR